MIGPTCPICQHIHTAGSVIAIGRFDQDGPRGYRAAAGPRRATRAEAEADLCAAQTETSTTSQEESA